jgi:hypothetical protein
MKFSRAQVSEKMNPEDRIRAVQALKWQWFNMSLASLPKINRYKLGVSR